MAMTRLTASARSRPKPEKPWPSRPTVLAVLGIVLAAGYILWMMERTFFGVLRPQFDDLTDASLVEAVPLALMVVTIIGVGVWPGLLTDVFESGLNPMVDVLNGVINP